MGGRGSASNANGDASNLISKLKPVKYNDDWFYTQEPGIPLSEHRMNPVPFVGVGKDYELDSKLIGDSETRVVDTQQHVKVDISELKTLQPMVTVAGVERALKGEAGMGHPVEIVKYKGELYVTDGNHRITAEILRGNKQIDATVYTRKDKQRR